MLVLALLVVGVALGYFVLRRSVALGVSVAVWLAAAAVVLLRSGMAFALDPDSVGVWVMLAFAPLGCGLGLLLRARRPKQPAVRAN